MYLKERAYLAFCAVFYVLDLNIVLYDGGESQLKTRSWKHLETHCLQRWIAIM